MHEIIAVVDAKNMVIEYNKIALQTKDDNPDCEMRAVWGDLVEGKEPVDEAWAADEKFDIIAMSVSSSVSPSHTCLGRERERLAFSRLAINFFACLACGIPRLQKVFETLILRLRSSGIILILDVEKDYDYPKENNRSLVSLCCAMD